MSSFIVAYTGFAKSDITEIFEFIAQDSYLRAVDFRDRLEAKILSLAKSPFIGKFAKNERLAIDNTRVTVLPPYLIFYSVNTAQTTIYIERILHQARENIDWIF